MLYLFSGNNFQTIYLPIAEQISKGITDAASKTIAGETLKPESEEW